MRMSSSRSAFVVAAPLCVAFIAVACGEPESSGRPAARAGQTAAAEQGSGTGLPLAAKAALDAGNEAFRAKRLDDAVASYRAAAAAAPAHAAPWFGLYMAAGATNNVALADSAMARVKALSQDPVALAQHASATVSPSAAASLPPGHPSTQALPPGHPSTQPLPPGHPRIQPVPMTPPSPAKQPGR
jgi:hypothetical protein